MKRTAWIKAKEIMFCDDAFWPMMIKEHTYSSAHFISYGINMDIHNYSSNCKPHLYPNINSDCWKNREVIICAGLCGLSIKLIKEFYYYYYVDLYTINILGISE